MERALQRPKTRPRVVIADDEPHVLAYLRTVLELDGFEVVGEAADADGAVHLADQWHPDAMLLDLRMPGDSVSAAQLIGSLSPQTHVVIFSAGWEGAEIVPLLRSGISGYVMKGCSADELVGALRSVLNGGTYLAPEVATAAVSELTSRLHAEQQRDLRQDRRRAAIAGVISARRFHVVVQPIVGVSDRRPCAVEALTRFSELPIRPPDQWFAEASEVGLRVPLELATARVALEQLGRLRRHLSMSINLSPETVLSGRLGEILTSAPLDRVIIELTEQLPVDDYDALTTALAPWRQAGARLAVDDAGSGYASFAHIVNLAPEYIKLDKGLTADLPHDRQRQALARAVIGYAREVGIAVIAEAVETTAQLDLLAALDVDLVQGFLLGHPLPMSEQPDLTLVAAGGDVEIDLGHPARRSR